MSEHRRLQRSRSNKMVAGVAGGIAEYANVDPLLVRVVLGALTIFGGAGLLIYALGWLLLPAADSRYSIAESLIGRGTKARSVVLAILLGIATIALAETTLHGDRSNFLLACIAVGGGLLLYRHLDRQGITRQPQQPQESADVPLLSAPMTYAGDLTSQSLEAVNRAADRLAAEQLAADDRALQFPPPEQPIEPEPERPRRHAGVITFCTMLVALGLFGMLDHVGVAALVPRNFLAIALAIVGAGLVVSAFRGGSRGLIVVGVPLTVLLLAASVVPWNRHAGFGGYTYRPLDVAAIRPHYVLNGGTERLDLTAVDFTGHSVRTSVQVGAGTITVVVPNDVNVRVTAHARAGQLDLFGATTSGQTNASATAVDRPGDGQLDLTLTVGVGRVEVQRVP